jgi:hypothetical protein
MVDVGKAVVVLVGDDVAVGSVVDKLQAVPNNKNATQTPENRHCFPIL